MPVVEIETGISGVPLNNFVYIVYSSIIEVPRVDIDTGISGVPGEVVGVGVGTGGVDVRGGI